MFESIFDLPLFVTGPAIVGGLCLLALGGLILVQRRVGAAVADPSGRFGIYWRDAAISDGVLWAGCGVDRGERLADLLRRFPDRSEEASALNALYRDVSSYPEPPKSTLQQMLRDYTDQVIHDGCFAEKGKNSHSGIRPDDSFSGGVGEIRTNHRGAKALHAETLRAYNLEI